MIDASAAEREAMRACLRPLASVASQIGFDRALSTYSEADALWLIDAIVASYTASLSNYHEAKAFPPNEREKYTPDPMRSSSAEFQDDVLPDRFFGGV